MRETRRKGYLLIELMIALLIIISSSLVIGKLCGLIAGWHQEASLYLKAATLARTVIEAGEDDSALSDNTTFHVSIVKSKPFEQIAYTAIKVLLRSKIGGKEKTFTFVGGKNGPV